MWQIRYVCIQIRLPRSFGRNGVWQFKTKPKHTRRHSDMLVSVTYTMWKLISTPTWYSTPVSWSMFHGTNNTATHARKLYIYTHIYMYGTSCCMTKNHHTHIHNIMQYAKDWHPPITKKKTHPASSIHRGLTLLAVFH